MRLDDVPEPPALDSDVVVETMAIGICGTDREIAAGLYGCAPDGEDRLVIGHESLGRVLDAPSAAALVCADRDWLGRLITRRVPLDRWSDALARRQNDIKVIIDFSD